jgi:large subunit ribosomal protein L21
MFAVIKTGGKQYKVAAEDVITVEKVKGEPGDVVEFAEVLMLGGDAVVVGTPVVAGATVAGEVVEQTRGGKVIAFKKRRRKNSRRKRGHRQELSVIRITEILTDGRKPTVAERPQAAEAAAPAPADEAPSAEPAAPAAAEAPAPAESTAEAAPKPKAAKAAAKKPAKTAAKKPAAAKTTTKDKDNKK